MNYNEKIEYLKKTEQLSTSDSSIINRKNIIEQEVYEFESNAFNVILNEIENEKRQIQFLIAQKEQIESNELFQAYCNDKISRHKDNITVYGNQIFSMYTREKIIDFYKSRKRACEEKIEYWKKSLQNKSNDKVSEISLNSSIKELEEITFAISLLEGTDLDMLHSYINVSDVGKKL